MCNFKECSIVTPEISEIRIVTFYYADGTSEITNPNVALRTEIKTRFDATQQQIIQKLSSTRSNCGDENCECVPLENSEPVRTIELVKKKKYKIFSQPQDTKDAWVMLEYKVRYSIKKGVCLAKEDPMQ